MKRKKISKSTNNYLNSDTLPFEIPPMFNNTRIVDFLNKNGISFGIEEGKLRIKGLNKDDKRTKEYLSILLMNKFEGNSQTQNGEYNSDNEFTVPYQFTVCNGEDKKRTLSVVSPLAQCLASAFIQKYANLIIYHCSKSRFSLRSPRKVASIKCYHDMTHVILRSREDQEKDEEDNESEILKSFFVYRPFTYLYAFYDSMYFIEQEKKFRFMSRRDISKCFDSIYTHSIDWAFWGKERAKSHTKGLDTFTSAFDKIMQSMNYGETNGIVIGPEFSRVFAEMILSSVDIAVENELKKKGKVLGIDYQIFRYVDDYLIFTNTEEDTRTITKALADELNVYKLHFNESKSLDNICRPFSTDITNAKSRIRRLIDDTFHEFFYTYDADKKIQMKTYNSFRPSSFITAYKEILNSCGVSYKDLGSYTVNMLVRILRKEFENIEKECKTKNKTEKKYLEKQFVNAFEYGIKFIFEVLFYFVSVLNSVSPVVTIVMFADYCLDERKRLLGKEAKPNIVEDYLFQEITRFIDNNSEKDKVKDERRMICLYLLALALRLGDAYRISESKLEKLVDAKFDYFSDTSVIRYCSLKTGYDAFCESQIGKAVNFIDKEFRKKTAKSAILPLLILDLLSLRACTEDNKDKIFQILEDTEKPILQKLESKKERKARMDFFSNQKISPFCWKNDSLFVELELKRGLFVY